jgi:hypothetical protein
MKVELLYFGDCPNWRKADRNLRALAGELAFELERRLVTRPEEAERAKFRGSPTILVDGLDPFAKDGDPFSLSCRIYQTPDGLAGSPTIDQLRTALDA